MSVQDDVGFTKLETARSATRSESTSAARSSRSSAGASPSRPRAGTSVTLAGERYAAEALSFNAFPSGTLEAVIALPAPTAARLAESCRR